MTAPATWDAGFDPARPDPQHEPPGECTNDPADTAPATSVDTDPGELPAEIPGPGED